MSTVVHVRRTIVVEYDVDRADFGEFTDDQVVAAETGDVGDGWSIVDYDDEHVTSSSAVVTFGNGLQERLDLLARQVEAQRQQDPK